MHYASKPLSDIKPQQVVIIAGTNDMTRDVYQDNGHINEYEIVKNIIQIGRTAREHGVQKVHVSGVLVRQGQQFRNGIVRVNNLLRERCLEENFNFIDQGDITIAHISFDGIHPNFFGSTILKRNILSLFKSFNPYLCTFGGDYEKAMS